MHAEEGDDSNKRIKVDQRDRGMMEQFSHVLILHLTPEQCECGSAHSSLLPHTAETAAAQASSHVARRTWAARSTHAATARGTGVTRARRSASRSGLATTRSASSVSYRETSSRAVRTWMAASRLEMFLVVRKTFQPAATRGVTWSKAALIRLE